MMESSQDEEECRSSESGWTMYLGSSMEEHSGIENDDEEEESDCDNVGSVHEGEEEEERDDGNEDDDNGNGGDSDDSMASDASSRPCRPGFWVKSDDRSRQGKGAVQGRGEGRENLKMGKKK